MSDELHSDTSLEWSLIYHLCTASDKKILLTKCFPALFTHPELKEVYSVIKELDKYGAEVSPFSVSNRLTEKYKRDRGFLMFAFNETFIAIASGIPPSGAIAELKALLYKRLVNGKFLPRIRELAESGERISSEVNKMFIAEASLLSKKLSSVDELAELTSNRVNSDDDTVMTGFRFLNKRMGGLTKKGLSGLLARPSHCKSTLSGALMYETIRTTNNVGLFISLEDPAEEIVKRMVAQATGKSLEDMRFKRVQVPHDEIVHVLKNVLGGRLYVVDTKHVLTPEDAAGVIADIKPTIVVVDYLQNFKMDDMVLGCIKALQILDVASNRNNCHIMVCSQVPDKQMTGREDPFPLASDTMWTSALYQKANEMFSMYYQYQDSRNPVQRKTLGFRILKAKLSGQLGDITLNIDPEHGRVIGEYGE